jgi:tRNA A-37 threonylcarbamoyl transferase component Bud32/tetratricopeptide (TPR) repeat protein
MSEPESKPGSDAPIKEIKGRIGRYDIVRPIGKGAMGMVYLAHDTILERDVALKVMVSQIADDPELNQRFVREAKAVAKMHHPNVVNVFDLGHHTDGSPYIAMELLKGHDLQKAMRTPPPMSLDRKVGIIVQVLAGLAHAHQQGIVHRDIKPANVFINQDTTVKIMDFGVARLTTASMTGTGNIVGTADYMSPEQVKGAKVDGRSDLFSVGCMLYELITGRRPFHSENLMAIFYKITHEEPNFDLVPEGAEYDALLPILKKSLAKELEERHQTAYEFAMELREHLKAQSTSASGEHALEGLLDMEPPAGPPEPFTDVPGATVIAGDETGHPTFEVGPTILEPRTAKGGRPGSSARTAVPGVKAAAAPTVIAPEQRATGRGAPARTRPAVARPAPPPPSTGHPVLYVVVGALGVALLGTGTYIALSRRPDIEPTPSTTIAEAAPPTTAAPVATVPVTTAPPATLAQATPPPTAAPPPTFAQATGRSAAAMKSAQAAFEGGDYDRAMSLAQRALSDDPGNASARRMAESALAGQKAATRFQSAEAALRDGDFARAMTEAEAGRALALWDNRGPQLISRIQRAQEEAQNAAQQREAREKQSRLAAQLNGFLGQAETALAAQKYDAAISLYDEALKLDPANQRAISGKSTAIQARVLAQAGASAGNTRPATGRVFVSSKTAAQSVEGRGGNVPDGFEDSPGVNVKKGTQAAELPGKIHFAIDPATVKGGQRYSVKVYLLNEGLAPIQIRDMFVAIKIDGKGVGGAVLPLTRDVAPGQKALLMDTSQQWREETSSWTMEVAVRTARGERYTNQVEWK